ncbi:MAG TPA: GtrA family protein [Cyclobacteriaceae bacterium]
MGKQFEPADPEKGFIGLVHKILTKQFIKFLIIGGLNTLFGYLIFCVFKFFIANAYLAIVLSTISGVLFNFKTYGGLVFKSKGNSKLLRFCATYLFIIGIQMAFLKALNFIGITNAYLAVAIMVLPMAALSFVLLRKFVFFTSPIPNPNLPEHSA